MKLFTGWAVSAGLVLMAAAANAQGLAPQENGSQPYRAVSDVSGPHAAMPPDGPVPGYRPALLPPPEVYTVLRESGFSPFGIPRLRGMFYVISVVDRRGSDGRLVIDARNGQIVRFVPTYRVGDNFNDGAAAMWPARPLPPIADLRDPPRPPASVPKVASRTPPAVPMPKAAPPRPADDKPLAEKSAPGPARQSAAMQVKPADTPATPQAAPIIVEAKPAAPQIQPTQPMPKVQGLE